MSGTSADALSVALIETAADPSLKVLAHEDFSYGRALRERILRAASAGAAELATLHFDLGRFYAQCADRFLKKHAVAPRRLKAVGSHGQTVIHLPDGPRPATLQIGEPSFLAERLGVPVVADFRPRDMAAGGQGAPLAPFLDHFLFGAGPVRALQNIGGIGNVSLAGRGASIIAFDTGPGNCLIDAAVRRISRGRKDFDEGGRMASRGRIDFKRIQTLLRLGYFRRKPPKSLDRGTFGEEFLERHFGRDLTRRPFDAVATLTELTVRSIQHSYRLFLFPKTSIQETVISGGGCLNPYLMERLRRALAPVPVRSIADFGIPPLAKEPAAFALMALLAMQGRINHLPEGTGARGPRILGKITL